jgi:hypothetical protein
LSGSVAGFDAVELGLVIGATRPCIMAAARLVAEAAIGEDEGIKLIAMT